MESVPFRGQTLDALRDEDGKVWVSLLRICKLVGVAFTSQRAKLQSPGHEWAVMKMIFTTAADGKDRETLMIDLESLPLWLVTINSSKTRVALRPFLLRLQLEAKAVLAAWFLGPEADNEELARELAAVKERFAALEHDLQLLKLDVVTARQLQAIVTEVRDHAVRLHRFFLLRRPSF
jgi:hypothetical protein